MNTIAVYVLIMVLGGSTSQSGYTTIQQEFNSPQACQEAERNIIEQLAHGYGAMHVHTYGCYKK